MKKYRLAILFSSPPFGTSSSREGLDALLAASAFCNEDEILICFLGDGVFNLVKDQQPEQILQKDHISTFKLIDLYDLSECFICQKSVVERNLLQSEWVLESPHFISQTTMFQKLANAEKVLTF